jgi:hypothetical protein|tara:strand:- start:36 stop:911 length:876 start_codon:yes stop_codon:yes gene_type:complete
MGMENNKIIIYVADMFFEECEGGAELTSDAIIESSPYDIITIRSQDLNIKLAEKHLDKYWVFGNFHEISKITKKYIIHNLNYSVIEFDYKYCKRRNEDFCIILDGECKCNKNPNDNLNALLLLHSKYIWWMSEEQKMLYHDKIPFLRTNQQDVLSSVFSCKTLNYITELQNTSKNDKYLIYNTKAALKNTHGAIEFAEHNKMPFNLVGDLKYFDFLRELSGHKGLIYVPLAKDTCPRLVIEAALLHCELYLNKYVQHATEHWFQNENKMNKYLAGRSQLFWEQTSKLMNAI